jgi:hypothetical protein
MTVTGMGRAAVRTAVGAGAAVARRVTGRGQVPSPAAGDRWHAVTVDVSPEELGRDPLAALGDTVEVRVRRAPGGRGTELHARLTAGADATREQVEELRTALRETKMRRETGEVLAPSSMATTTPTPLNAPLRAATAHGRGEGRL